MGTTLLIQKKKNKSTGNTYIYIYELNKQTIRCTVRIIFKP